MNNQMNDIAALFLYCRHQKKLSQRAIASLLRVNQSTVCRIECGVIVPRKRTVAKLERLMQVPLEELLPLALEAKTIHQNTKKVVAKNPVESGELSYEHLSDSDVTYLKSKWHVLIAEAETAIGRKSHRLKKSCKKHLINQVVGQHLDEQLNHQQQLLDYLGSTRLSRQLLQRQYQHINALSSVKKHHDISSRGLTSVELFLQKMALEEMAVIKRFRMQKMRELACYG